LGEYTQDNRIIKILSPLGKDVLLLQRFSGEEGLSRLFDFSLYLHSENRSIQFDSIVGKKATVIVTLPDGKERYLNGVINSFYQAGSTPLEGGTTPKIFAHYHATLVPHLWMLTRTSDCRIFQGQTVPEIIQMIFDEHKLEFKNRLHGNFEAREYCVQYRETDFNFVSRLMEEEGIFYFFEHERDKHTLILANNSSEFKASQFHADVTYKTIIGENRDEDVITEWTVGQEVRPGRYAINDFNFEQPTLDLTAAVSGQDERKLEVYDYPGEYVKRDRGEQLVGIRMEEQETPQYQVVGSSFCRGFIPGFRFGLRDHYRRDFNKSYVITSVYHASDQGTNYRSSDVDALQSFDYTNHFQCMPYPRPFRPPRVTPVPVVQGTQTAIVVGPPGEEIYTDKYGRVKAQFHWDREGKYNDKSSCWIRVSQNWAGKRWGAMFLPRIGQEVIIDFLEGDPDQPIIIGRVYNGNSMPPYDLPAEKTKSTIQSLSSKGGGGYNEFRMEDKKGEEQIFIHAQKNQDIRIEKDLFEWVGEDSHLIVKRDQKEKVEGDKNLRVAGDHNERVDGTISIKAGVDLQEKIGMKHAVDAGMEIHLKAGMNVVIEAGVSITLKAGGGFIVVGPTGVTISGMPVLINSGGSPGSGSGSSPENPADPTEADKGVPGQAQELPPPKKPPAPNSYGTGAVAMQNAARDGTPFVEPC